MLGLALAFFSSAESFFSPGCNCTCRGVEAISVGDGAIRPGWDWSYGLVRSVPKLVELNGCRAQRECCDLGEDAASFCFGLGLFSCHKHNGVKSVLKSGSRVFKLSLGVSSPGQGCVQR